MNSWQDMHEIIDLPRVSEDDIIPDNETHLIFVHNPINPHDVPYVPIVIAGYQWDFLWWIYRLWSSIDGKSLMISFDMFTLNYIEKIYEDYIKRNN